MKRASNIILLILCLAALLADILFAYLLLWSSFCIAEEVNIDNVVVPLSWFVLIAFFLIDRIIHFARKVLTNKHRSPNIQPIEFECRYTCRLNFRSYLFLMLKQRLKEPIYYLFIGVLILPTINEIIRNSENEIGRSILPIALFFLIILVYVFFKFRGIYLSSLAFREPLEYYLNQEKIIITGESFNVSYQWTHFKQSRETKDFVILTDASKKSILLDLKQIKKCGTSDILDQIQYQISN